MPVFSATRRPSLNASICTASETVIAVFNLTAATAGPGLRRVRSQPVTVGLARARRRAAPPPITRGPTKPSSSIRTPLPAVGLAPDREVGHLLPGAHDGPRRDRASDRAMLDERLLR